MNFSHQDHRSVQLKAINLHYYEEQAAKFIECAAGIDMTKFYKPFFQLLPGKNAHILDLGCGSGRDSSAFQEQGYQVTAIDASPAMVRATSELGVTAKVCEFQDINYDSEFDAIWACASLLHVPKTEIDDILKRMLKALKPGGISFICVKSGNGEMIANDGRFFAYYQEDEFNELLKKNGWYVKDKYAKEDANGCNWLNFMVSKPILKS